jgi:hypothetical protein
VDLPSPLLRYLCERFVWPTLLLYRPCELTSDVCQTGDLAGVDRVLPAGASEGRGDRELAGPEAEQAECVWREERRCKLRVRTSRKPQHKENQCKKSVSATNGTQTKHIPFGCGRLPRILVRDFKGLGILSTDHQDVHPDRQALHEPSHREEVVLVDLRLGTPVNAKAQVAGWLDC